MTPYLFWEMNPSPPFLLVIPDLLPLNNLIYKCVEYRIDFFNKRINIIRAHSIQNNSDHYSGEYEIGFRCFSL